MNSDRGVTLLELILFILVVGIAIPPLLVVASHAVYNTVANEIILKSTSLAEEKMEEIKSLNFDEIVTVSGNFDTPFQDYIFSINVYCVRPPDYETQANCGDYKRVEVLVNNSVIPEIESTLVTIITKR
ncbi:MAG: hypothetical protein NC898_03780 [Candidatus Omnitrophica bacterium]|nr:hypothetical protein [Candidatus Omnitrophota bacterium]MCM8793569.1 hypothetical protein [Candidatus Omnitrophota bacterium]